MQLKDKITRLEAAGVTEDEICHVLKIPHRAYRKHTALTPSETLSYSCKMEIRHADLVGELTLLDIAALYKTNYNQVHLALYQNVASTPVVTKEAILAHLMEYDNLELTKKTFKLNKKAFTKYLKEIGWAESKGDLRGAIAAFIIKNPDLTYEYISEFFDVSLSTVAKIAIENKIVRQEQNRLKWQEVLDYAATNGVTSAAKHFGISRTIIYYHRKKQNENSLSLNENK